MALTLMYITNNPDVVLIAEKNGVERIWIDLETLGKEERQKGINSVKSRHTVQDIATIKPLLTTSEVLVRVNPWNVNSKEEIDAVVASGADIIMLPMWKSAVEVQDFLSAVNGRTKTTLLLETSEAENCLDDVLKLKGINEIHIGLNDLHLSYGMTFMFELLADGTVEKICNKIKAIGLPYGFGGLAKIGDGMLPAEKIILEHYRLGSTRAILSRTFCDNSIIRDIDTIKRTFELNLKQLRAFEEYAASVGEDDLLKNKTEVFEDVNMIVEKIKRSRVHG